MIFAPIPDNDSARLSALRKYQILDTQSDQAFDDLISLACKLLSMPIGLVSLVDDDREWFKSRVGLDAPELPRDISFCGHAILHDDLFEVPDATKDERFFDNPLVTGDIGLRFYAGCQLQTSSGLALGMFCVLDREPRALTDDERNIIHSLSRQANYLLDLHLARAQTMAASDHLKESNELFLKAVLDNLKEGVVVCNRDGILSLFNRATRLFHGVDSERLPPEEWAEHFDLYEVDGFTPMSVDRIPLVRAYKGEHVNNAKMVIAPKGGKRRTVTASGQPMYDANGELLGAVVSMYDLTELQEIEAQLVQSQKLESIGRLSGGISHDFNNILGIIIGNLDLAKEDIQEQAETLELIDDAIEAAMKGADLTQRLLAFARKQPLQPKVIDIEATVTTIVRLARRVLGNKIVVEQRNGDNLWPVDVDPAQLEAAVLNLAVNARDAMPDGGRLIVETANICLDEVYASNHAEARVGDFVEISVFDTGTGMSDDVVKNAFEPFFSTKEASKGSGLGLSMVHGFVRQSGGHATIYSELGVGTTVKLYLPRSEEAQAPEVPDTAIASEPRGSAQSILVVEDDLAMQRVAARQLDDLNYRTFKASSATEALELLESETSIDLVFSDIVMPGPMSGVELAHELLERYPNLPVILTSGFSEQMLDLDLAGVSLLRKPYRKLDLAKAVHSALDLKKT